ncbi:MAG: hypothetical protein QXW52_08650 [Candidatus Caldarchaeum sp.]
MDEEKIAERVREIIRQHFSDFQFSDDWEALLVLYFWEGQGLRWMKTGFQKLVPPSTIIRLAREKCMTPDIEPRSTSCLDSAWREAYFGLSGHSPPKVFKQQEQR